MWRCQRKINRVKSWKFPSQTPHYSTYPPSRGCSNTSVSFGVEKPFQFVCVHFCSMHSTPFLMIKCASWISREGQYSCQLLESCWERGSASLTIEALSELPSCLWRKPTINSCPVCSSFPALVEDSPKHNDRFAFSIFWSQNIVIRQYAARPYLILIAFCRHLVQLIFDIYWKLVNFLLIFGFYPCGLLGLSAWKARRTKSRLGSGLLAQECMTNTFGQFWGRGSTPGISPGELNGLEVYVNL